MTRASFPAEREWLPLLVPDMPSPQAMLPWLERMHQSRHYSNFGPLVRDLEAVFAHQLAVPAEQLTTVANATLGLELVLQALDLSPGSHVLLPALTFVATATAVVRAGHVPVLADVDAQTWMLTPEIARAACAATRVDAVLPVATFGMPHDMCAWAEFGADTSLPVVIDAAAAYGNQWMKDGCEGTLVFSLHTTKSLPAGEGGLVVSTRAGLAARVRQLSNFGINLDPRAGLPLGTLADVGTNAKMSEYHAAVALASMETWAQHAQQRRELHGRFRAALDAAAPECLRWQDQSPTAKVPPIPTLLCTRVAGLRQRAALERACAAARIMTRRWYQPLLGAMGTLAPHAVVLPAPNARALSQELLGLPFFWGMTEEQQGRVVETVSRALAP
jgi:dTDP-4-amino-4,6-dideoxygalactose transaminase